jgi:hypothetical protein
MSIWSVLVNGSNLWLELDGKPTRLGFFTTRLVEARDAVGADRAAAEMILGELAARAPLNAAEDPPVLRADEIREVAGADASVPKAGFTFYREKTDS